VPLRIMAPRVAVWMLLFLVAASPLWHVTTGQVPASLPNEYRNAECGLIFRYPANWDTRRPTDGSQDVILESRVVPTSAARIGPVEDWPASRVSPQNVAQAMTAYNCLQCLQAKLVWLDRYTEGSRSVNYTIAAERYREADGNTYDFYALDFHLVDEGASRGLEPGAWILTTVRFLVPKAEYQTRQHEVRAMVSSIQFSRPTNPRCWP